MTRNARKSAIWLALCTLGWANTGKTQETPPAEVIEIIGTSPLPGQGVPRDELPYTTTVIRRGQLDKAQAQNLSDLMARRLPGVQVNDVQGSPFQGDLTFRGYRASGLLGAPQGLSVYLDGVRINEPFGDVVNWDLVPEFALDSVSLVPGANPAFGLNSLGGAIALTTATGRSAPGLRAQASYGSFARKRLDISHGGEHAGGWEHYVALGGFDETGWRDASDGDLGHVLAKLGHRGDLGDFSANLLVGRSRLVGNGLVPLFTIDEDTGERTPDLGSLRPEAVYTFPDLTRNRLTQFSMSWRQTLEGGATFEALAFARDATRTTINGDEADDSDDPIANAAFNQTATDQRGSGVSLALSSQTGAHRWQVGGSFERATVGYVQTEQEGSFTPARGVVPLDEPPELSAQVDGNTRTAGLYATDTWRLATGTHVTATLRLNHSQVSNQLDTVDDDTGELEVKPRETFSYRSANPAIGIAQRVGPSDGSMLGTLTVFANVARNTRVPTVIELGCADPEEPCRLPAGLQADPYLKQVVATTLEGGMRFGAGAGPRGSLTLFRTNNRDDILFRSVSVSGQLGFFQNFERTRHQGLDAEVEWPLGRDTTVGLAYSLLEATYGADGVLRAGERNVQVREGTRIAGLPRHTLKASADWTVGGGWTVGADLQALSRRTSAGNEDGLIEDGASEPVDLSLPGYAVVNLRAAWAPPGWSGVSFFAGVNNLFDRCYASFGALAETQFDAQGAYVGEESAALFVAPGTPRAFTLGLRAAF